MPQRLRLFALGLVGKRKVIVRVRILRNQRQGALVGLDRLRQPCLLIQYVAQIEEGQRILRIGLGGLPVELLGPRIIPLVVADGAEIDGACSVRGHRRQHLLVHCLRVAQGFGTLFKPHRPLEDLLHLQRRHGRLWCEPPYNHAPRRKPQIEIKGQLRRKRINQRASLPKRQPCPVRPDHSIRKRIH